ncbi:MAG: hypothetical protein SH857_09845 [Chitinophagales bacterium]|nr:hypothetical protein [Chitinophagales bacterium]
MNEIFRVTTIIQKDFPELYKHLSETPLFLSTLEKEISTVDFEQYLESIQMQLTAFERKSPNSKMCE